MFHIFNRVIVYSDVIGFLARSNEFVISKGQDYQCNIEGTVLDHLNHNQYYESYNQWLNEMQCETDYRLFDKLFDLTNNQQDFRIYADKITYATILIKTLKMLFGSKVSKQSGYLIYHDSLMWMINNLSSDYENITSSGLLIDNNKLLELVLDQATFENLFANTKFTGSKSDVSKLLDKIKDKLSNEFVIANYIKTKVDYDNQCEKAINRLFKQSISSISKDMIDSLIENKSIEYDQNIVQWINSDVDTRVELFEKYVDKTKCVDDTFNVFWNIITILKQAINSTIDDKIEIIKTKIVVDPISYHQVFSNGNTFSFNPILFADVLNNNLSLSFGFNGKA